MKKSAKLLIAMVLVVLLVFTLLACGETDIQQSGNNVGYTISFETNGGSAVADIVVDGKTEITIPETSKEGYSFAGWFLDDKTFSIKVDLSYIKANPEKTSIKLYAKWIEDKVVEKTYKIVFSTNGGSDIADIVVDGKSEITMLNTTKSGYTFAGWYVDNNTFNIPFCLNYITANPNLKVIKIYAKWTTNRYTVTFDSNGGSVVAPITQEYNTLVVKPKNPTKTENNFVAWYKDSNLTVAFNFATDLLTKDTILYAKWTDQNLDQFFDFAYVDSANTSYSIKKKANINLPNEIVLPSSFNGKPVTAIEYGAFSGCSGLTSVTIPNSVTSIGDWAFSDCSGLTGVTIPDSVTSIGGWAFYGCNELSSIAIPDSVTSIGSYMFDGCSRLSSITIPDSVTSIGMGAFYGCNELSSIAISNSVTSIGDKAFYGTAWLNNQPDGLIYAGKVAYQYKGAMPQYIAIILLDGTFGITDYAFDGCNELSSISIPSSVTSIGMGAFNGCSGINSITIPNSVTSIGSYAFQNCSGLTSVTIGSSVTSIGGSAFNGCSGLTGVTVDDGNTNYASNQGILMNKAKTAIISVPQSIKGDIVLPNTLMSIGSGAFSGCSGLTSVTIGSGVTSIGEGAFYGCSGLTSITIPNSVTNIGYCAFQNCSGLTAMTLPFVGNTIDSTINTHFGYIFGASDYSFNASKVPASLKTVEITGGTSIGSSAFYSCYGLTSITVPNSVTSIGSSAFNGCYGLTSITVPNSVTSIGQYAFFNCSGLNSITIPNSVTGIGYQAFQNCSGLTSMTLPFVGNTIDSTTNTHFGYIFGASSYSDNASYVPASLKTVEITGGTSIGQYAFNGCSGLTGVTIGSGVTIIGENAFSGCSGLTSITLPFVGSTLGGTDYTYFGYIFGAYSYSSNASYVPASLKTVEITGGTSIGEYAFYNCGGLTGVTIGNGVTSIGGFAFYGCSGLTSITIPTSVTSIGSWAFRDCSKLTSITIPNSVTSVGESVFAGTAWLNNQPDGLIYASTVAYQYKGAMPQGTAITLRADTTGITSFAFSGCSGLTTITIPNSVTSIGGSAFNGCSGLTSVTVDEGNTTYASNQGILMNKAKTEIILVPKSIKGDVVLPSTLMSIGYSAFSGCGGLTSIIIPASVTSIGEYAFSGCSGLTSITIPDSIISIYQYAFSGCSGLTTATIGSGVTSIGGSAFYNCSGLTSMTLPFVGSTLGGASNTHFGYIFGASSYGDNANYVPARLKTVEITGGTSIGQGAFSGCGGLTMVTIPNSVTSIGGSTFNGCSGLTRVTVDDGNTTYASHQGILMNKAKTEIIFVPKSIKGDIVLPNTLTSIGRGAFSGCSGLTSITIPNSVTNIGYCAFQNCSGLTSITLPFVGSTLGGATNTHFGYIFGASSYSDNANYVPTSLKTVVITGGISIGEYAFSGCSGLTSATIGSGVTSIGSSAFSGCSGLTAMTLPFVGGTLGGATNTHFGYIFGASDYSFNASKVPASLKTVVITGGTNIGQYAFYNCSGLTGVTIPNSVTSIGYYAFYNCSGLTGVTIPNSVTSIGGYAFSGCSKLTSVTIPNSVTSIGEEAFEGCSGLTTATIGSGVTSIGSSAFSGCSGLTSITLPFVGGTLGGATNTHFGYIFGASDYSFNASKVPASLKTVVITGGTNIGQYAFYNCSGLTGVTIPNSVTSIGYYAFYNCSGLTGVTIPNSVTSIGYYAFYGCSGLTGVTVPSNVTSIYQHAFSGCSGLTSITIPNSVTSIYQQAFYGCSGLTTATIGSGVTRIGEEAFKDCIGLTTITIGSGLTSIGRDAFNGTAWLNNQPDGLIYAGKVAYRYKGAMPQYTAIILLDGTFGITDYAFSGCSELTSITIPNSVTSIGNYAFYNCSGLTSMTLPFVGNTLGGTSNTYFGYIFGAYNYNNNSNYVPASLKTVVITGGTSIGEYAFSGCSGLTGVTIPNSVTSIGGEAFKDCSGLTSITIPDSVTGIGSSAFQNCSGLTSITLPFVGYSASGAHFGYIFGASSYHGNSNYVPASLKTVVITGGTNIGQYAFYNCSGLTGVTIPNSVTSIGYYAFYGCSGLTGVTIPNSVTSIGDCAFYYCTSLTSMTLPFVGGTLGGASNTHFGYIFGASSYSDNKTAVPASLSTVVITGGTSIGEGAFSGCSGLTGVTIPDSVTSIEKWAFSGCSGLTSITVDAGNKNYVNYQGILMNKAKTEIIFVPKSIKGDIVLPNTLTSIGEGAFSGCSGLTSITIPDSVTIIEYMAFSGCSGLTTATIGSGVTRIEMDAFKNCSGLTTATIGSGVTSIGGSAFSGCIGLTTATIGSGVTSIGGYAFSGCSGLTSITIPNSVISIGYSAFSYCSGLASITIGSGVTSIEDCAFCDCSGLTSIIIPASVTQIDGFAFSDCSGLTTINCEAASKPSGWYSGWKDNCDANVVWGYNNIKTDSNYDYVLHGDEAYLTKYKGTETVVAIPSTIGGYAVVGFGAIFSGYTKASSISIPNSVTSIGYMAFSGCWLKSITIGSGVTSIGESAFSGCSGLTGVTIPNSVTSIGGSAFEGCSGLTRVTVDEGNTTYASHQGILMNKAKTGIILVPESLKGDIILPNTLTGIGAWKFHNRSGLTSIIIGSGVIYIGKDAFAGCSGLKSITIPNSVTGMGEYIFTDCSGLTINCEAASQPSGWDYSWRNQCGAAVNWGYNNIKTDSNYDYVLHGDEAYLTKYKGTETVVTIPSTIGGYTVVGFGEIFRGNTTITRVTIPSGVIYINNGVFSGCSGLTTINCEAASQPSGWSSDWKGDCKAAVVWGYKAA